MKKIVGIVLFIALLPVVLILDLLFLPIKVMFELETTPFTDQLVEWIVLEFLDL